MAKKHALEDDTKESRTATKKSRVSPPPDSKPPKRASSSAKYIRFDDADDDDIANEMNETSSSEFSTKHTATNQTPAVEADSDSDSDSAPETITTSAAQQRAKKSTQQISKALIQQRTKEKAKRRERDARLKAQVEESSRRQMPTKTSKGGDDESSREETNGDESSQDDEEDDIDDIPDLPRDVLSKAFTRERPPTPPPASPMSRAKQTIAGRGQDETRKTPTKLDLQNLEEAKVPKDRKVGPVNVRVLSDNSAVLPPKGSGKDKALREAWLMGRRGRGGKVLVQRRAVNSGFSSSR